MMPITTIPQTPPFLKGIINLRGKVIPVIDLRLRFEMESIEYNERTCIIVVEIDAAKGIIQLGIVVDSVCEVLNILSEDIEEPPRFGTKLNTEYISGVAKMEGAVKILLHIEKILNEEEINSLDEVA